MIASSGISRPGLLLLSGLLVVLIFLASTQTSHSPVAILKDHWPQQQTSTSPDKDRPSQGQTLTSNVGLAQQEPPARKLWQTAKTISLDLDDSSQTNIERWVTRNPDWRYELLTDYSMDTYVSKTFEESHPALVDVFTTLRDSILRADFIRYLVLFGDGGVYNDLDTECLKPIEDWIPAQYADRADLAVVGIEYDTFGLGHVGALLDLQLINWTLMSRRAGHKLYEHVAKYVANGLQALAANQTADSVAGINASFNDVLATTGPAALTLATWEYLAEATGDPGFGWQNVTGITEPLLVHDVLIMPVTSFGNGQSHSHAGTPSDPAALVHHQFKGGWKVGDHSFDKLKNKEGAKEEGKEEKKTQTRSERRRMRR